MCIKSHLDAHSVLISTLSEEKHTKHFGFSISVATLFGGYCLLIEQANYTIRPEFFSRIPALKRSRDIVISGLLAKSISIES